MSMRCVKPSYRWTEKWYHVGHFSFSALMNWHHLTNLNPRSELHLMRLYRRSLATRRHTPEDKSQTIEFIPDDDDQQVSNFIPESYAIDATGKPVNQQYITDLLINSEVLLSQGEEQRQLYKVIWWSIDGNGRIIGISDNNTELNTLVYDAKSPDSDMKNMQSMWLQWRSSYKVTMMEIIWRPYMELWITSKTTQLYPRPMPSLRPTGESEIWGKLQ